MRAPKEPPAEPPKEEARWPVPAGGLVIVAATAAAYAGTFSVPLLYDDESSIAGNPTLRHLATAFWPPVGTTMAGRPVLNLSMAFNYAVSGTAVWSYHALNLAIHILAALALFGIVRRTLALPGGRSGAAAAFSVACLWALHPIQTQAVTYIVQRAESLMGLFYLLTLYCFIRGAGAGDRSRSLWYSASVGSCLLGMATKEVMASAPLVVLLYDRTFMAGGFGKAWRRRRGYYAALCSTWLPLGLLVLSGHGQGAAAGPGAGPSSWSYALTQFQAIVHYLKLCFLPYPLVFDYGTALARPSLQVLTCAAGVTGLAAATAWALCRHPAMGFLGTCFFAILAPSSSVVPVVGETMADYRMYLALIPVLVAAVLGIFRWAGRAALPLCMVLAAGLGLATAERNRDYSSALSIWSDTVAKRPGNYRAHSNLAGALIGVPGRLGDAVAQYEEAVRLRPESAEGRNNLANALSNVPGRTDDAVLQYEEALRLKPDLYSAYVGLGNALSGMPGRLDQAIACYEAALRIRPDFAEGHFDLGNALSRSPGRLDGAVAEYEEALRLKPGLAEAHFALAVALLNSTGRTGDAIAHLEAGLKLRPGDAQARRILADIRASGK
jgi:protein O-mannosyl-transferase